MKLFRVLALLLLAMPAMAQNGGGKTGIIDYGNASLLYVPKSAGSPTDLWSIRPGISEMAFSADEETVYIKSPETYITTRNPEKRTLFGWSLISQKKESFDVSKLPLTRKGREILSLFTPHYPLVAFIGGKKKSGSSCWISADLNLTLGDDYGITISDTSGKTVSSFKLPDYLATINPTEFKLLKTKPKDYEVDLRFCYYPKLNILYISGDCGRYGKGYNRLWQYQLATGQLTEIPVYTSHIWDNGNGLSALGELVVSFSGDYIIRQYFTEYNEMHYEFISAADGRLDARLDVARPDRGRQARAQVDRVGLPHGLDGDLEHDAVRNHDPFVAVGQHRVQQPE